MQERVTSDWEDYLERMSRNGEWVDENVVAACACYLKEKIRVISGNLNAAPESSVYVYHGHGEPQKKPLQLGHIFDYHYESLKPRGT